MNRRKAIVVSIFAVTSFFCVQEFRRAASVAIVAVDLKLNENGCATSPGLRYQYVCSRDKSAPKHLKEYFRWQEKSHIAARIINVEETIMDSRTFAWEYLNPWQCEGSLPHFQPPLRVTGGLHMEGVMMYRRLCQDQLAEVGAPAYTKDPVKTLKAWFYDKYGETVEQVRAEEWPGPLRGDVGLREDLVKELFRFEKRHGARLRWQALVRVQSQRQSLLKPRPNE